MSLQFQQVNCGS